MSTVAAHRKTVFLMTQLKLPSKYCLQNHEQPISIIYLMNYTFYFTIPNDRFVFYYSFALQVPGHMELKENGISGRCSVNFTIKATHGRQSFRGNTRITFIKCRLP